MPRYFLQVPRPIAISDLNIGSLVLDIQYPREYAHYPWESEAVAGQNAYISTSNEEKYIFKEMGPNYSFAASLLTLITFGRSAPKEASFTIEALKMHNYTLKKPKEWLRRVAEHEETREWIEDCESEGQSIYLVTGMVTYTDATVHETSEESSRSSGGVSMPIGQEAGGKMSIDLERSAGNKIESSYTLEGEHVFFVQYQRVILATPASLEAAVLANEVVWTRISGTRALHEERLAISCEIGEDEDGGDEYHPLVGAYENDVEYLAHI